ncbi:MAG: cupin domain-containing protein [Phycisphaerales bacterium]
MSFGKESHSPSPPAPPLGGPSGPSGDGFDVHELAALCAMGAATPEEVDALEALVKSGDAEAILAAAEASRATEALLCSVPEAAPPEDAQRLIRMRLGLWEAQTVAGGALRHDAVAAGHEHHDHHHDDDHEHEHALRADPLVVVRKNQIKWRPTGLPGVQGCTLYADKKNNRRTILLNMAPGSYIPDHNHAGIEEVLVLEGDLNVGDVPLKAGDYFRAQADTKHGAPVSPSGCIALVFSTYSSITTKTKMGFALQVLKDLLRGRKVG